MALAIDCAASARLTAAAPPGPGVGVAWPLALAPGAAGAGGKAGPNPAHEPLEAVVPPAGSDGRGAEASTLSSVRSPWALRR